MKKIFLFLGAALVSMAMQATVVTQDISLSGFTVYTDGEEPDVIPHGSFNSTTLEFTGFKEWGGGQIWYGDDNAYALDAGDYAYIGMDLAVVATNDVRLYVEYTTADGHSAQPLLIKAGKTSHLIKLNGRYIKKLEISNFSNTDNASFTLSKVYFFKVIGKETPTHPSTSDHSLANWDWDNRLQLENTWFDAIHEGDKIVITYTSEANEDPNYVGATVRIKESNAEFTDVIESEIIQESQTNATFEIVLREADIEPLKTKGMYINGKKIVINKVDLYTYAQHVLVERTLNTGYKAVSWEGIFAHWDDIPTLYEGDELRATVVANDGLGNYQLYFRYDWEHDGLTPDVAVDGTVNKIYTKTLTAEEAAAINATHDLLITGTGLTVSRFAIAQSMSIYDDNMLWREETAVTTWDNPVSLSADKFANLTVGDVINVTLSSVTAGGQLWMTKSDATPFTPKPHYIFNSNWVAPLTISYVVNQDMVTDLRAGGLLISGENFTITSVHIIEAPARQESYQLTVGEAGMATLVLPFNVQYLPDGVEAYELSNSGSSDIFADQVNAIEADKPVLILAPAGTYTFYSEQGANADISGKYAAVDGNYTNGALIGNYVQSAVPTTGPNTYNYILQKHGDEAPAFYQVQDELCSVAPYRAYLSCGFPGNTGGSAPKMRIVFHKDATTGIESQELKANSQKLIRNGQILIIRDGRTYNALGTEVK